MSVPGLEPSNPGMWDGYATDWAIPATTQLLGCNKCRHLNIKTPSILTNKIQYFYKYVRFFVKLKSYEVILLQLQVNNLLKINL